MTTKRTSIANLRYTARGKGAAAKMPRAVRYYTYRDGLDSGERVWRTSDGRELVPAEARAFAQEQAGTHGFTYQIVLSNEGGLDIGEEGYRRFLDGEGFKGYMFIEHHNTDNAHAHVIAWRSQVISKKEIGGFIDRYDALAAEIKLEQEQNPDQARTHVRQVAPAVNAHDLLEATHVAAFDLDAPPGQATQDADAEAFFRFLDTLPQEPGYGVGYFAPALYQPLESRHEMAEIWRTDPNDDPEAFFKFLDSLPAVDWLAEQGMERRPAKQRDRDVDYGW